MIREYAGEVGKAETFGKRSNIHLPCCVSSQVLGETLTSVKNEIYDNVLPGQACHTHQELMNGCGATLHGD
jgi:hypothetical protein